MIFWLRACPRCRGDLYMELNELDDEEIYCMQCGYRTFRTSLAAMGRVGAQVEPALPRAA